MQRARRALHLLGHVSKRSDGTELPNRRSLLFDAWEALAPQFNAALVSGARAGADSDMDAGARGARGAAGARTAQASSTTPGVRRQRLGADWQVSARTLVTQRLPLPSPALDERVEYSWVGQTARAIGTVVHAELQRLSQLASLPAGLPAAAQYHAWLAELGVPAAERAAAAADVLRALNQVQQDAQGRWLLASDSHREASSEVRISGMYRGELVNISIDRMLVDRTGTRWVVDYKTNRHEGGELEAFIASEVLRYRPQLQRYAALAARLGPEPLRCALYFPLSGIFREVPV
jgi:ATP-dependent exoDNAse (exonuclease V) beta subunit